MSHAVLPLDHCNSVTMPIRAARLHRGKRQLQLSPRRLMQLHSVVCIWEKRCCMLVGYYSNGERLFHKYPSTHVSGLLTLRN